jgi:SNF2 family DNA or RNA helicase
MELRPYQKRIANWLCQHPHACLSVGMGLGKTAAVLHFLDYTRRLYPHATALIVAPKRVAETVWMQEAEK